MIEKFYSQKFKEDEGVGYQFHKWDENPELEFRRNQVLRPFSNYSGQFHFYAINPIDPLHDRNPEEEYHHVDKPRITNANVTDLRTFLIEFDDVPLKTQTARVNKSEMPYTAKVFSGSKSYHYTITLDESLGDGSNDSEYRKWHKCIENALLQYELKLDDKCNNPARLSRAPGAIHPITGNLQELIEVKELVSKAALHEWLRKHNCDPNDVVDVVYDVPEYEGRGDANDDERFTEALSATKHFNGDYPTEDRQPWLYELASWCKAYELDERAALSFISSRFQHDTPKKLVEAVKNAYKYSKKSKRTLYTKKEASFKELEVNVSLPSFEKKVPYDHVLSNYKLIGDSCFLVFPDNKMTKMTQIGFNARFTNKQTTFASLEQFSDFGYWPDYFSDNPRLEHDRYNAFVKPNVIPKKGEFPMTKILFKHIWGELEHIGWEYYWVLRNRPTHPLPCIALTGAEDGGKTTFADHLDMCFKNISTISTFQLTKEENKFAANKQIIVVEESSSTGNKLTNPSEIANKVKMMVTQCGKKIPFKQLYDNAGEIEYFGHVVMLTNDITPIQMAGEATRFCVLEVGKPKKIDQFVERLRSEVPAVLWYLDNEYQPSRTESKERLWFHPDEYYTEAKDIAKTESGSYIFKKIKDSLRTWFKDNPDAEVCYFDQGSLKNWVLKCTDDDFKKGNVKDCLVKEFKWGEPNERLVKPDSLRDEIKGEENTRKMAYWAITPNFEIFDEKSSMEKLLNGIY